MARYGEAAVWAARMIAEDHLRPEVAWERACGKLNPTSIDAATKGCPRTTFLTLCEEGFVRGVQRGHFSDGRENAEHALALARLLVEDSDLADSSTGRLWKMAGGGGKKENGQVEVAVALSRAGLLVAAT